MHLRTLRPGEKETVILTLLEEAFGDFHEAPGTSRVLASQHFDHQGCFIIEEDGSPVGSVAVTSLPRKRAFVIRYLVARNAPRRPDIVEKLLGRALQHLESKQAEYVRATTPAIQPYVDVYKRSGFSPVRRDFRMSWDISDKGKRKTPLVIERLSEDDAKLSACAKLYLHSLRPLWDWRTEEQGGPDAVYEAFIEMIKRGETWVTARLEDELVGLGGLIPDYYETGQARFRGVYVSPAHRDKGVGSWLMSEVINLAKDLGQQGMKVYTFSYLDCLAPGALLYLKSGGKIEAEYTQLELSRVRRPASKGS